MYEASAHTDGNYLYIKLVGLMQRPEAEGAVALVIGEGKKLKPGFSIINDISEALPTSQEIAEIIKEGQTGLFAMGAKRVIRIGAGAAATNLQFTRTQRESHAGYESHVVATRADAMALLNRVR